MMTTFHIVTDSCAHFPTPQSIHQYPMTVVPNVITVAGKPYREGIDLTAEETFRLLAHQSYAPTVTSPSESEYFEVYNRLARTCDGIISIHASREIFPSWHNAREAAVRMAGHCKIEVVDSQSLSAGQAMLVKVAARAIEQNEPFDDIVRSVRGAVERVYSVFYVESMDYLLQNKIMDPSHTILGAMLGIKPFLTMENGHIVPMEKVKTRVQAVERLVEFAAEFTEMEDAIILQHKPYLSDQTRMLQERLALEFPGRHFPYALYGPSLAALIGVDATGFVVLESALPGI
jgi:fatty acid kinase fatty acid binding subunit